MQMYQYVQKNVVFFGKMLWKVRLPLNVQNMVYSVQKILFSIWAMIM